MTLRDEHDRLTRLAYISIQSKKIPYAFQIFSTDGNSDRKSDPFTCTDDSFSHYLLTFRSAPHARRCWCHQDCRIPCHASIHNADVLTVNFVESRAIFQSTILMSATESTTMVMSSTLSKPVSFVNPHNDDLSIDRSKTTLSVDDVDFIDDVQPTAIVRVQSTTRQGWALSITGKGRPTRTPWWQHHCRWGSSHSHCYPVCCWHSKQP